MVSFSKIAAFTTTVVGVAARPLRNNGAGKVTQHGLGVSNTIPSDGTKHYDTLDAKLQATIEGSGTSLALIGDSECMLQSKDGDWDTQCIHEDPNDSDKLVLQNNNRAYVANTDGTEYYLFKMEANQTKTVSFDVNYNGANTPCGTNATVYLVDMLSQGGKYCDANYKGYYGEGCAEIDLTEGNMNAQQFTSHACSDSTPTDGCDGDGDYAKSAEFFSPGNTSGGINTNNSFNVSVTFVMGSTSLTKLTQTITQDGNTVTNDLSGKANVTSQNIADSLMTRGMVFTMAFWSNNELWMENGNCGSQDPDHGSDMKELQWTLDNFTITTA